MSEYMMAILDFLAGLGYVGIVLGLLLEVIPSELVLGYGGYLISRGNLSFSAAFMAGVAGGTLAQLFLYWAGYIGGRPFLLKYGKYIWIKEKQISQAESWFEQYGTGVIFAARFIPVVRHAISIPAGIARMPFWKFTLYTAAAMIPWTIVFLMLGLLLGENWSQIRDFTEPYMGPAMILILLILVAYLVWKKKNPPVVTVGKGSKPLKK
ncbi:DedA family protein [Bacillus massiliglaciei]|uniref:DedA family protein n=1 Tax=Bacillus massiliglaciei TaxID=1816693 RepID=UPI0018FE1A29|nr:DedA family protein [Bacillus massiliglaciei]